MLTLQRVRYLTQNLPLHLLWGELLEILLEDPLQAQTQALPNILLLAGGYLPDLVGRKGSKGRKGQSFQGKVLGRSN